MTTPVEVSAELRPSLAGFGTPPVFTLEGMPAARAASGAFFPSAEQVIGDRPIDTEDRTIPGPAGEPDITVTILRPRGLTGVVPGLYNIHGGGMMTGHRVMDTGRLADLVETLGVVAVNVEYRLAPEHPHPAPVEDCYAGLVWMAANAAELGVDADRIIIMGGSAGGGLSAGVALLARDRRGPALIGQLLLCPMIDDRNDTVSSHQYPDSGTWTRQNNDIGWKALLGGAAGTPDASPYAAPLRATDLTGLPPAYIEVGAAEVFRDENVEYASRIWAVGGNAELHVWAGAFHGFDIFAPESIVARAAIAARESWFRRILGL